ncbi:VanZ family protein [Streptomyces sp. SID625]|nr:VanZ family protein [Streptomyces sp. SID625]
MQLEGSACGSAAFRVRVAGSVLLAAHLALVAWLMLRPLDVPWVMPANLRPLTTIRADLALGGALAVRRIGEGLVLLAPLGVLLPMAHGRIDSRPLPSGLRTTAAGALVSVGIALLQSGVPGRVVDVDTMLLNTAGVALVYGAVVPAFRARLRRRTGRPLRRTVPAEETAQGRTPTIPRVGIAP